MSIFDVALTVRIVWIEVMNLVLLCLLLGSVVGAAPKAQPKATWNAQKVIAQLRVLLGTFYIHVHYLCALPVPLSEKVSNPSIFWDREFWGHPPGHFSPKSPSLFRPSPSQGGLSCLPGDR